MPVVQSNLGLPGTQLTSAVCRAHVDLGLLRTQLTTAVCRAHVDLLLNAASSHNSAMPPSDATPVLHGRHDG